MWLDPKTCAHSLEGKRPRSSPRVADLAEWRQAARAAEAVARSCARSSWFLGAGPALGPHGRPVVRVTLRWTPDDLPTVLPVRWDGVPVVLRRPSGNDLDMREVATPRASERATPEESTRNTPASVGVQVTLPEQVMSTSLVGLIETLAVAGLVRVHENDVETGAVLDIPAADPVTAEKLRRNLEVWRVEASLLSPEET